MGYFYIVMGKNALGIESEVAVSDRFWRTMLVPLFRLFAHFVF